jgi:hypothetical protein
MSAIATSARTTFYVDEIEADNRPGFAPRAHRWNRCHLATDGSLDQLHEFAEALGVSRGYYYGPGGIRPERGEVPYYDLTPFERRDALRAAADRDVVVVAVTSADLLARARGSE